MSIESTDILMKLSTATGPGNSTAGSPASSLGGFISTTEITDATLHNLFDFISGDENIAGTVDYRCLFVHNANATDTFLNVKAFIPEQLAGGANIAIGLDPAGVTALASASAQAAVIADETTAPAAVAFSTPIDFATGLAVGSVGPAQVFAVWVRRTATDSDALAADSAKLRIQGESL